MSDEITPDPVASQEAAPVPTPEPEAPVVEAPVVETPPDVPPVIETVVDQVEHEVVHLASEVEADAALALEAGYREVSRLESAANAAIRPLTHRAVSVLHSDTTYREAAQVGNEGPHQEQIHTSLTEG